MSAVLRDMAASEPFWMRLASKQQWKAFPAVISSNMHIRVAVALLRENDSSGSFRRPRSPGSLTLHADPVYLEQTCRARHSPPPLLPCLGHPATHLELRGGTDAEKAPPATYKTHVLLPRNVVHVTQGGGGWVGDKVLGERGCSWWVGYCRGPKCGW